MTLAEVDWAVLRRPTILLVLAIAVSAGALSAAYLYGSEVQAAYTAESRRLATNRGRYLALDDEKRLIEEYYPQYESLARQGRIGEEQRLDWLEALRAAAARNKLPSLQYEIGAQKQHEPDFPVETGRYKVYASDMRLTIGLFHEEDLPRFFGELSRRAAGLFSVSSCRIKRVQPELLPDPTKANLEALCTLLWYTVKPDENAAPDPLARRRR